MENSISLAMISKVTKSLVYGAATVLMTLKTNIGAVCQMIIIGLCPGGLRMISMSIMMEIKLLNIATLAQRLSLQFLMIHSGIIESGTLSGLLSIV
jgi:uncharacterized membrane protein